jgi:hypothetical protein
MRMIMLGILMLAGGATMILDPLHAGEIPSQFGVDAPELAHPGQFAVGIRRLTLTQKDQVDVLAFDPAKEPRRAATGFSRWTCGIRPHPNQGPPPWCIRLPCRLSRRRLR